MPLWLLPAMAFLGAATVDPVARVALGLACVLAAAWLGGRLATWARQPAVLGELAAGLLLGNLPLGPLGPLLSSDPVLEALSGLGVIVLMLEAGLGSSVAAMREVGRAALLVALIGVIVPLGLGWGVARVLLPAQPPHAHAFLGAALCATSVGITARVLKDLGRLQRPEARIILGAAVIDDVLGLLVLSVVGGLIAAADAGTSLATGAAGLLGLPGLVALVVAKAVGFLGSAVLLGRVGTRQLFGWVAWAGQSQLPGTRLVVVVVLCLVFAWTASALGLAPMVGAFAAGLVLEDRHARALALPGKAELGKLVEPLAQVLVPVFFVQMGLHTQLGALVQPGVLGLAFGLTAAAVLGKQACGLGAVGRGPSGERLDRLAIGIGMIPRGEVGLIFVSLGSALTLHGEPVLGAGAHAALVIVILVTTAITPPLLRWRLARG